MRARPGARLPRPSWGRPRWLNSHGHPSSPATSNDVARVVSHAPNGAGFGVSVVPLSSGRWFPVSCARRGADSVSRGLVFSGASCFGRFPPAHKRLRCPLETISRPLKTSGLRWRVSFYTRWVFAPSSFVFGDRGMAKCAPYAVPHPFLRLIYLTGGRARRMALVATVSAAVGRSGVARARSVRACGLVARGPLWLNSQGTDCISCVQ